MAFICNAQQIPSRPTPPRLVNDYTNTLNSSQEHYLEQKLRNYNDTTSTQIAVVFVNDLQGTTAADIAYQLIIYHAICAAVIWPAAFTLPSAFRAASDVKFPLVISMISMWTFRVGLCYVFSLDAVDVFGLFSFAGFGMGPLGVWVAMTVDWVFRTIFFVWRYFKGTWLDVYKRIGK